MNKNKISSNIDDFGIVSLSFSDRFLESQLFSNVFILSSLALKFSSTISFLSLKNQMPSVLNDPFFHSYLF